MASPAHITNHAELALARLLQQYVGKPNIEAKVSLRAAMTQAIEDALWQLFEGLHLDGAEGIQLDRLGKIVLQPRGALDDAQYALAIAARIRMLRSSGTVPDILAVFATLFDSATNVELTQWFPAALELQVLSVIAAADAPLYLSFLDGSKVAGVRGILLWQETEDANCFTLSDAADCPAGAPYLEIDEDTGLGDETDATAGGDLTGAAG